MSKSKNPETFFVGYVNAFFRVVGGIICRSPWTFIGLSTLATIFFSLKIPFTPLVNNISDFTPYEARARAELEEYRNFFSNKGEPKAIYAFCTAKSGRNLLGVSELNATVQVLDMISKDFYLKTINGSKNFEQFCNGFCSLNEPVRHFYSGSLISDKYTVNESRHLDLGYPVTTVLGTKLYMDPNFFGVQIAINDHGLEKTVSVADSHAILDGTEQVPNNIRQLDLIVLQFRAEIGANVDPEELKRYEREILNYFHNEYSSPYITVYILTDSYITSEIVRAGLSLLPFLVIGFLIMAVFSSATFAISASALGQWSLFKLVLAVMACVAPFMACGVALGGMFWCGIRFGSILCVTPFLVLAIGVDDAYLMVNAWQRITNDRRGNSHSDNEDEIRHRTIAMLVETGPSVAITTITNIITFGIGALTPTPEIQLFSIGNALAVMIDFVFQLTIYAALMVIVGKYEVQWEKNISETEISVKSEKSATSLDGLTPKRNNGSKRGRKVATQSLNIYCSIITNKYVSSAVLGMVAVYWYVSVVGAINIRSELSPDKLFLQDSNIVKIFEQRKSYIIPYYEVCWILVGNPGDISDPVRKALLHALVEDLERLPGAVGRYSTKFWLRDYEDFLRQAEELDEFEDFEEPGNAIEFTQNGSLTFPSALPPKGNELKQFLEWPEFSFWNGFLQFTSSADMTTYNVTKFFVTTAFHGDELVDWSNRAKLLRSWRAVADKYPELAVTVYEEDGKFLDLIETMAPIASQSALFTFLSMFAVAFLFISHPPTLAVATLSILSTSLGVFGTMSWWGADLDPILMSATVMSIGFSVDIPSHISYHYYMTGANSNVRERLEHTIAAVGFPILQASLSTILCVSSLFFVQLHMAQLFAKCMLLVVVIGMVHGLLVIPIIFNLIALLPACRRKADSATSSTI